MALKWLRDQFKHLKIVLWAVVAVFVLLVFDQWGRGGKGVGGGADFAVRVGDTEITREEYIRTLRDNEERLRSQLGDQWEQFRAQLDLPRQTAQQLVQRELMLSEARDVGLVVSDEEVQQEILRYPMFLDSQGNFVGPEGYQRRLRSLRMTSHQFEESLRQGLLLQKLQNMVYGGVYVSDSEVEETYRRENEVADFDVISIAAEGFLEQVTVDDAELAAYHQEHAEEFRRPEQRVIRYLVVETSKLRRLLEVEDSELVAYYESHRDEFVEGEQAHARHILFRLPTEAGEEQQVATRMRAEGVAAIARSGADFAVLAEKHSEDPGSKDNGGDLGWFGRRMMTKEFEDAVFNAKPGEIVGPVLSQYGYHVIKIEGFQPQRQLHFDEVKDQVRFRYLEGRAAAEAEVRAATLERRLKADPPQTDEAWQQIADEDEAVVLNVSPPFGREQTIPGTGDDRALVESAFAAEVGGLGTPRSLPRGWMVWQLASVLPEGVPPLQEVRDSVEQRIRRDKALDLAMTRATGLAQQWRAGADAAALADSQGTSVFEARDHRRGDQIEGLERAAALDQAVFAGQVDEVVGPVRLGERGVGLARVARLQLVDLGEMAGQVDEIRSRLARQRADQLLQSILNERRRNTVVTVNNELMEQFGSPSGS